MTHEVILLVSASRVALCGSQSGLDVLHEV